MPCSGLVTGQAVTLDIVINGGSVPITSRASEPLAVITQAGVSTTYIGSIVTQGGGVANNDLRFSGLNITDPNPSFSITGVRANVNPAFVPLLASGPAPVVAQITASGALALSQNPSGIPVGTVLAGLSGAVLSGVPTLQACGGSTTIAPSTAFSFSIAENSPAVFKTLTGGAGSESGPFVNEPPASSATQFAVTIGGTIPAGLTLFLPTSIVSDGGGVAQLVSNEGGAVPISASAPAIAATIGTTYFYNVVAATPLQFETYTLPVTSDPSGPVSFSDVFAATLSVSLAPLSNDLPSNAPIFSGNTIVTPLTFNVNTCQSP